MFRQRLTDKANGATTPVEVIFINTAYTSMRCSKYGHTEQKNRMN
ncbi:MAG: zinc ribbon domain-containing protein [Ferrimicrobium acidiphilum]